jgi:hypothetical protein
LATQTHQSLQAHGGIRPAAMRLGLRRLHRLQRSSDAPHLQRRHGNRAARGIVGDAPRGEVCRNRGWEDERKSQPYFSPTAGRIVSIALPKMCKSARHPLGRHACRKQNSNDEKQAFNHLRQRKIKCNSMARQANERSTRHKRKFGIGFVLGYGIRELISRRRRSQYLRDTLGLK